MNILFLVLALPCTSLLIGCSPSQNVEPIAETSASPGTEHVHEPGDELMWPLKEKIAGTNYEIWLGHHGKHFHAGDTIEPAAIILENGNPMESIQVTFRVSQDESNSANKNSMIFEPETPDEPAHYAGLELRIPDDAGAELSIWFDIGIASADNASQVREIKIKVGH